MKWFRACLCILGLFASLLLISCSHKAPATRLDREKWDENALQGRYHAIGTQNSKWDKDAEDALSEFAQSRTASSDEAETLTDLIGDSADSAVGEGCSDPMVCYLHVRYSPMVQKKPLKDRQDLYLVAANNLENSPYSAIWKFHANVDAANILWWNQDHDLWQQVVQHRYSAISDLAQAVQEQSIPEAEVYDAADVLFQLLQYNTSEMTNAYHEVEAALAHHSDKAAMADFIKAKFYIQYAWIARGHGTADQVTPEGWRLFKERLGIAHKALEHAWSLDPQDPQIPTLMISVVLGEETGKPEMEKWFERAMKADPDNYDACRAKLHFLLPQWYGSREEMVEFGRQCVASTNWGGHVPLILVDAHSEFDRNLTGEDRRDYWYSPDVWPDIKAGYEKFAQLNPDQTRFRYPYAWYAFRCGQTNDFVTQINLIRTNDGTVNYGYFGGKESFDRAWAYATGHETQTNQ